MNSQRFTKIASAAEPLVSSRQFLCYSAAGGWVGGWCHGLLISSMNSCALSSLSGIIITQLQTSAQPPSFTALRVPGSPHSCLPAAGGPSEKGRPQSEGRACGPCFVLAHSRPGLGLHRWPFRSCLLASSLLYPRLTSLTTSSHTSLLSGFWQVWLLLVTWGSAQTSSPQKSSPWLLPILDPSLACSPQLGHQQPRSNLRQLRS